MKHASIVYSAFAIAAIAAATAAHAQQDTTVRIDEHWRPYLGCWATSAAGASGPMVCVVPTASAQTVEFVTVVGDSITTRANVSATGARVERTRDKCTGSESGRWSIDERRLYTHAEFTCPGGQAQQQDGLLTMRTQDEFTRIEGVRTRGGMRTRIVHFSAFLDSSVYPAAIASRIPSMIAMPSIAARMEASADVSTADVVDATKELDSPLVEAWLGDRGQTFALSADDLRALRGSKVPEGVIDMLVALANPQFFMLAAGGSPTERSADPFRNRGRNRPLSAAEVAAIENECLSAMYGGSRRCGSQLMDWNDLYFPWFGYPIYRGFDRYSNQYGPYGPIYGNAWYGGTGGGYVIIPSTPKAPEPPGRVINGQGYSQGGASGSSRADPRSPSVGTQETGGSGSSGGGSAGGGGGTSAPSPASTGGGEQRTAKPRP